MEPQSQFFLGLFRLFVDDENWNDEQRAEWLASNPPIPSEGDPFFTPEHIEWAR